MTGAQPTRCFILHDERDRATHSARLQISFPSLLEKNSCNNRTKYLDKHVAVRK